MKKLTSWASLLAMLMLIAGPMAGVSAERDNVDTSTRSTTAIQTATTAASNAYGIYSVAACRDTTTVTVSGSSGFATNRIQASVSYLNSKGVYALLQQTTSDNFGSGSFWVPVILDYHLQPVDEGTSLQVIVQLQRSTGSGFTDLGSPVTTYVTAADKFCQNQCSVTLSTSDRAPARGVITLRSHFGKWFRPEGWLHGAISVNAGQTAQATFAGVSCGAEARAWFYPATGTDRTPRMLPSQYWPGEFGVATGGGSSPYATSFARGLPATAPLESDDPYAPK